MKHTVYTLLFGLIPFLLIAQEPACGTQGGELFAQQLLKDLDLLRQHEARFAGDPGVRTTTSASLPVQFHVVRTSGGGSSLTQGTLNQAVVILNNYFQYAGIQFFQCAAPIYIDDSNLTDFFISQQKQLVARSFVKNVINIYCVNSIEGGGVGGYTYLPGTGQPDLIVMDDGLLLNATLTHEMGHFFGLLHTHGASNCPAKLPGTDELADGSNCLTAGDYVCDTPADPGLLGAGCQEYQVSPSCEYIGISRDAKGAAFRPDVNNVMSYSRSSCRNRLTPGQYARINAIYQEYRTYLACSDSAPVTKRLSLSSPIFISPNPVKAGKPFTVSAQVSNTGNAPFTGKVKAVVFNRLNEELSTLGVASISDTLAPGQVLSGLLEFSNPSLLLSEETYKVGFYFLPDSATSYQLAGNEKYASYVSFTVEGTPLECVAPDSVWVADAGLAHLIFEWTASPVPSAYYKVAYREKGKTDWTEIPNWSANRMVIVNRKPCTAYEFRVLAICPEGQSEWSPILSASTKGCQEAYCLSYGNSLRSFIQEVSLGAVRNISGNDYGYKDFTSFRAEAAPGGFLPLNLVPGRASTESVRIVYWRVWADLNRDLDFDDSGEMIFQGADYNTQPVNAAWQVPDVVSSGEIRIRISMDTKAYPTPCAVNDYRDVEDYSLVVTGPLTLTLNPTALDLPSESGAALVELNAGQSWESSPDQPWLQISRRSGPAGKFFLTVSATGNPDVQSRVGTITFKAGSIARTLKVAQAGKRAGAETITFPASGGERRLLLNSGTGWKLLSKPTWITQVIPGQGTANGTNPVPVDLSCAPNPQEKSRSGLAVFQWDDGHIAEIEILQDPNQVPAGWGSVSTGTTHMILIPPDVKADFGGLPLLPGDYIGFFYLSGGKEQCAGVVRWEDKFAMVPVFGDDPASAGKDGFATGETFKTRVWQLASQREWKANTRFAPLNSASIHTHTDKFFPNGISQIAEMAADTAALFSLTLKSGFDLISLPVVPSNLDFLALVDPVKADLEEIQDAKGAKVVPATSLNQIGNFDVRKGYLSKTKKTTQLWVTGNLVKPSQTPIPVPLGWSIIPFWSLTSRPLTEAISSISPSVIMIKDQEGRAYIPAYGINTLGQFLPGKAYWLLTSKADTLRYPDAYMDGQAPGTFDFSALPMEPAEFFRTSLEGEFAGQATIVLLEEGLNRLLDPQDEIGVYDPKGNLAGSGIFQGNNLAITVEGMAPGEAYVFRIWKRSTGKAVLVKARFAEDQSGAFASGALVVVEGLETIPDGGPEDLRVYPNPAAGEVWVALPASWTQHTLLRLMRMDGAVVQSWIAEGGNGHRIRLGSAVPGIYILQAVHGDEAIQAKLVVR